MIGILIALKSILEIDVVAGALGALDAGLNIAGFFSIMKSKLPKDSIEIQMISALDESLRESCKKLGWYYDSMAAYMWLDVEKILSSTVMTKESLDNALELLTGKHIDEMASNVFVDCFDKSVAGKPELFRYLNQKWMRYRGEVTNNNEISYFQSASKDFSAYYSYVEKKYTRVSEYAELVGAYSDEEACIDAYIEVNNAAVSVLSYLESWFENGKGYGTLLIYGEPGHGKTLLCNKSVVEYSRGNFLKNKASNVMAVSLNTGYNPQIIKDGIVDLEKALIWGFGKRHFTFEDCRGALLFMDGFDEFVDDAKNTNIKDIETFMTIINGIADEYDIHVVVLSRTIAVQEYLKKKGNSRRCFMLMPLTNMQQDAWLDKHSEYNDYRKTFNKVRINEDMKTLLGIPFLFRLIVNSRFDQVSTNVVELYDMLFDHLMAKRYIRGKDRESVIVRLSNLAYDIYCTGMDTAVIDENEKDSQWIIAFYVKQIEKERVGFFHRSFYQYFLAEFIYTGILTLSENNVETFIGYFAERELDDTVRQYISLMLNENDMRILHNNLELAVNTLVQTEAILNVSPRFPDGNTEKTKIGRITNVFRNTMHICAIFSYAIKIPFKGTLDILFRTYRSDGIIVHSNEAIKANLTEGNLYRANLRRANMHRANLRGANLSGADLREADLSEADLSSANLQGADLSGANLNGANLSGANLSGTDLSRANLSKTILSRTNLSMACLYRVDLCTGDLREADLSGANMKKANLVGANLRDADLCEADLGRAQLRGANLIEADMGEVNLYRANLSGAKLSGACLNEANLSRVNLSKANLSKAELRGADLSASILRNANLNETDLNGAKMNGADLRVADLRGANINKAFLNGAKMGFAIINPELQSAIDSSIIGVNTIRWE